MKRLFVVMVASMAMSYAMAQCAQTGSKEGCKSKCEERKECGKQEKASVESVIRLNAKRKRA